MLKKYEFKGTFREYQQRVLDSTAEYLDDGKLHIVAAPGSGKTILGLELICRLGGNALILSPSIAIREQWGERFRQNFLSDGDSVDDVFSTDLHSPSQITSITYQGLYSAWKKAVASKAAEEDLFGPPEDYSDLDLLSTLKENKITTICLDEAHHLRAEWQKALQAFISAVEHDCRVISLTATPPYDSDKAEWDKYIQLCGEIDDEIFVPELVRAHTLCPHQDYIYLNYPTTEEINAVKEYQHRADEFMHVIFDGSVLSAIKRSSYYSDPSGCEEELFENPLFLKALLSFLRESGDKENKILLSFLKRQEVPSFGYKQAENLFSGILYDNTHFLPDDIQTITKLVHKYLVVERKKVCIRSNSKLDKLLVSSVGKLTAISEIAAAEYENLGDKLRLLVLTDYIKSKTSIIGTDAPIMQSGVAPIFELLRRNVPGLKLAALSGEMIIVPNSAAEYIESAAAKHRLKIRLKALQGTEHSEVIFTGGSGSRKVALITQALNEGVINAVVGTKSLLGEGWDSPVINTLILASFVGSYMLSNQMRGRAIRIDKSDPDKVSNIWHLVTVLPDYLTYNNKIEQLKKKIKYKMGAGTDETYDYAVMTRRFDAFVGLNKNSDTIENGLSRIMKKEDVHGDIAQTNKETLALAKNRDAVANKWHVALEKASDEIVIEAIQPKQTFKNKFYYLNILQLFIYTSLLTAFLTPLCINMTKVSGANIFLLLLAVIGVVAVYSFLLKHILHWLSPFRVMKAIASGLLEAFKELKIINKNAELSIENADQVLLSVSISAASRHEQNIFNRAVMTLFSPIENPRYLLVKNRLISKYYMSFAIPDDFASNKKSAELFAQHMKKAIPGAKVFYTRSGSGRELLNNCRRHSFISLNYEHIYGRKKLKEKWH